MQFDIESYLYDALLNKLILADVEHDVVHSWDVVTFTFEDEENLDKATDLLQDLRSEL